jgi:hypothetical protein
MSGSRIPSIGVADFRPPMVRIAWKPQHTASSSSSRASALLWRSRHVRPSSPPSSLVSARRQPTDLLSVLFPVLSHSSNNRYLGAQRRVVGTAPAAGGQFPCRVMHPSPRAAAAAAGSTSCAEASTAATSGTATRAASASAPALDATRTTSSCARTAPHRLPDPDPKSCSLSTN